MIRKTIKGGDFKSQMVGELVFDQVPEEGSFNPVTSDAVVKAIDEAKEDMQDKIDEVTLDPSAVALGNVHLLDEVTEFPADGCILIDSETNGPGEMSKDTLLELTAQNALGSIKDLATTKYKGFMALDDADGTGKFQIEDLFGSIAPIFDPAVSYTAWQSVMYQGKFYTFKVDHPSGAWDASHVDVMSSQDCIAKLKNWDKQSVNGIYQELEDRILDLESVLVDSSAYTAYPGLGVVADPLNANYGNEFVSTTCDLWKIYCNAFEVIEVNATYFADSSSTLGIVFYDYADQPIGSKLYRGLVDTIVSIPTLIEVPSGAYYFKASILSGTAIQVRGFFKPIKGYCKSVEMSFVSGYAVVARNSTSLFGRYTTSSVQKSCRPIYCSGFTSVYAPITLATAVDNARGIVFFDKNLMPLDGVYFAGSRELRAARIMVPIPNGACFVAATIPNSASANEIVLCNEQDFHSFVLGEKESTESVVLTADWSQGALSTDDGAEVDSSSPFYNKRIRSKFINVEGSEFVCIPHNSDYTIQVFEYDGNSNYNGFTTSPINNIFRLRDTTTYIRLVAYPVELLIGQPSTMEDVTPSIATDIDAVVELYSLDFFNGEKKGYTPTYERFKVLVNQKPLPDYDFSGVFAETTDAARKQALWNMATDTLDDGEVLLPSTGVIALPKSYTKNGKPTKLILFAHGGHGYVDDTHWYPTNTSFPAMLEKLLGAGYAVFDCNGYKDTSWAEIQQIWNAGNVQISEGLPQVCEAYYKCFRYIVEHYNVEPRVYIWGCSQGGHLAMNFGWCHRDIVAAIAMMAGQIDLYDQGYSYQSLENKRQVAKLLGFDNTEFIDNTEAMQAYQHFRADKWDPMKRIVAIDGQKYVLGFNIPIKFFYGSADTILPQVNHTIDLVEALQNSKVICYMRVYDGLDHNDVAVGHSGICLREAVEWFNRF